MQKTVCTIIALIGVFTFGYYFGTEQNQSGRYFFKDGKVYDTSTGDIYHKKEFRNREIVLKENGITGKIEKIEIPKN